MSDLSALIDALSVSLRPHAASPVTVRRLDSDVSAGRANGTQTSGYGRPNSLSSRRRGGKYPNTYRPTAKDFAGIAPPVTQRPAWGSVKPAGRTRIDGPATVTGKGKRRPSAALLQARANGEDNGTRARVRQRYNLAVATGGAIGRGTD